MKVSKLECVSRRKFQRAGERQKMGVRRTRDERKQNQDDSIVKRAKMEGRGETEEKDKKDGAPRRIDGNVANEMGNDSQRGHEKWVGGDGRRT